MNCILRTRYTFYEGGHREDFRGTCFPSPVGLFICDVEMIPAWKLELELPRKKERAEAATASVREREYLGYSYVTVHHNLRSMNDRISRKISLTHQERGKSEFWRRV
jgi:hypothetical protein